ncbi:MAG: hypothetical protein R3339_07235, partial [Thermodesulfobacteriota bacterium]|nr:hypothetical protein [Thermodesulfobacteriota bacterium]
IKNSSATVMFFTATPLFPGSNWIILSNRWNRIDKPEKIFCELLNPEFAVAIYWGLKIPAATLQQRVSLWFSAPCYDTY